VLLGETSSEDRCLRTKSPCQNAKTTAPSFLGQQRL
jgi:hypothetical protein